MRKIGLILAVVAAAAMPSIAEAAKKGKKRYGAAGRADGPAG